MDGTILINKEKIEGWLKFKGWTQKQLADEMNYKESNISAIINGNLEPSKPLMKRLGKMTGFGLALFDHDFDKEIGGE